MQRFIASLAFLIFAQAAGAQDQSPPASVPPAFAQPPFIGGATPPTDLSTGIGNYCIVEILSTPLARLFALARQVTSAFRAQTIRGSISGRTGRLDQLIRTFSSRPPAGSFGLYECCTVHRSSPTTACRCSHGRTSLARSC